ncbi:PAS domain-containing sensor histidine kinase [Thermodesulfobacteriota bacterium]
MKLPIFVLDKSINPAKTILKIGAIITLVIVVTLMHYQTAPDAGIQHVIFRELYFLPIVLAGFWFGLRGGLTTSLVISFLYGPLILTGTDNFSAHDIGNIMEVFLFNLVGGLLGWLKDRENTHQDRARQAESLAAMGRAAAMIAHDLKTPLVAIGGLSRQLSKKIAGNSPQGKKVEVIRQQADRLENMVLNMLDFAKPLTISRKSCDLNQILKQANEAVFETAIKCNIKVDIQKNEMGDCNLDEEKILQVLINLISNAIEASPDGETVTVSFQEYKNVVHVEVSDRGKGVEESISEKIFEPFISTKSKGTGLGLPICKKIVEVHSGKLEFRNNPDVGTTFRVSIPKEP